MDKKWSSEAHKVGAALPKAIEDMTAEEIKEFRNSFDPDTMGFDGAEFISEEEGE